MSYNITSWKTKEIFNLLIPLDAIKDLPYTDVEFDGINIKADGLSGGFALEGNLIENNMVEIIEIKTAYDSSGSTWNDFIRMLEKSSGTLIATQIWEGGDSISKLTVNNGEVIDEPIEL
jgi:hypothetical protein